MLPFLIKAKDVVLDILFPPLCLNCQKHLKARTYAENNADLRGINQYVCRECLSLIKLNNTLFCPVCRARLAENKFTCGHFITAQINVNNPHLSASNIRINPRESASKFSYLLAAAGNYDNPVLQNLIYYFKYKKFKNLAPVLGEILIRYLDNLSLPIIKSQKSTAVVPLPLHKKRERERGFNQAKLLAEIIAKQFNLELIEPLKRIKNTKPQSRIKDYERRQGNVFNCFKIKNPEVVKGKNIILVDDVFTSGATMNEAIKILKQNGAKRIIALVLAKA